MPGSLVSIVLPVYNGAEHLGRSINSVLKQTYQNWELIIVNDCSTDNSLQIAEQFSREDARIRIVSHEKNKKLPAALNTGFRHSRGDFLTWTSHDNEFKQGAIKTMVDLLLDKNEIGFVFTNEDSVNENTLEEQVTHGRNLDRIIYGNVISACFLYRRSVMEKVGEYDENLFLAEDWDYFLRIWKAFPCCYIDQSLYRYYYSGNSLTATRKAEIANATLKTVKKNLLSPGIVNKNEEFDFLLSWFKYWFKYSFRQGISNYRIMLEILIKMSSRHPGYLVKYLFTKS